MALTVNAFSRTLTLTLIIQELQTAADEAEFAGHIFRVCEETTYLTLAHTPPTWSHPIRCPPRTACKGYIDGNKALASAAAKIKAKAKVDLHHTRQPQHVGADAPHALRRSRHSSIPRPCTVTPDCQSYLDRNVNLYQANIPLIDYTLILWVCQSYLDRNFNLYQAVRDTLSGRADDLARELAAARYEP